MGTIGRRAGGAENRPDSTPPRVIEMSGFLAPGHCQALVAFFKGEIGRLGSDNATPAFTNRQINYERIPAEAPVKRLINQCRWRIADIIREAYGARHVYPDYTDLVFWPPGEGMVAHADNANEDGSPNPYSWRTYSAIVYLNQDYSGGATFFPDLGTEVQPETGKLVVFGAGSDYRHGVRPIMSGERFTMPLWFTDKLGYVEL